MRALEAIEESALMKRLILSSDPELRSLAVDVQSAAKQAADLLTTVALGMPLYTLHSERHVLNVLWWMENLLGATGIENLSALECAVSILSAYTHDLGMTLSREEREALMLNSDYLRFRDSYVEERHLMDSLHRTGEHYRANLIEDHLRTEYIRTTHSDQLAARLIQRIAKIAPKCIYRGFDYRRHLELVAISHNQEVDWLRFQCEREQLSWRETVGKNEPVNFACIGILLRLADVMDFDASRTPLILFRQLGLDAKLANRFEELSSQEWKKHLAITGIEWPTGGPLTYRAANCPDPVIEKSIREFVMIIRHEVSQAASELRHLDDKARVLITLPDVRVEIRPIREHGKAAYTYHDWHFRLDQEEIIRLLMGESLYGEPSLCIRELLQNALDAVELRDLRLQLRAKGSQPVEPVDGESLGPGRFVHDGIEETFAVNLTWGEENGHQYIRVEDNGTGMTEAVIQTYFTQIGKSFYRSSDFRGEWAEMRSRGLIATPISTFGIGVLSCFMIADRVQVRTHPGQLSETRQRLHLEIAGPGSLFWTRSGTRTRQGTEVTLWLRKQLRDKEVKLEHDQETCFRRLRAFFGHATRREKADRLDPGTIAGQHVVWPKYPIYVSPPNATAWAIDDRFHPDLLAPIDRTKLARKAQEWGYPVSSIGSPCWELLDWTDDEGAHGTGSRVRLWLPATTGAKTPLEFWELATLLGPQVTEVVPLVTVQSMGVEDIRELYIELPIFPGNGCRVWIDLRGPAVPALTADRNKAFLPKRENEWRKALTGIWERYATFLASQRPELLPQVLWNHLSGKISATLNTSLGHKLTAAELVGGPLMSHTQRLARASLVAECARTPERIAATYVYHDGDGVITDYRERERILTRDLVLYQAMEAAPRDLRSRTRARARNLGRLLAADPIFAQSIAIDLARGLPGHGGLDLALHNARGAKPAQVELLLAALHSNWFQEAFFPSLSTSWAGTGLRGLDGRIGDALLTAPAAFRFDTQGRLVLFADPGGREPKTLVELQYDICFPMTAIPLGNLRRCCAAWREDRRYRAMGVLPFLRSQTITALKAHADELVHLFSVNRIYALIPAEELWYKPFATWTPADWKSEHHLSLLWNIAEGEVLVSKGVRPLEVTVKRPTLGAFCLKDQVGKGPERSQRITPCKSRFRL